MSPQHILMLGASGSLAALSSERVTVVEGDVLDTARLTAALAGQSLVYAGLAGNLPALAESTVSAMNAAEERRLGCFRPCDRNRTRARA